MVHFLATFLNLRGTPYHIRRILSLFLDFLIFLEVAGKMPTARDYYRSMTRKDLTQFATAAASTLCIGALVLFLVFRWLSRRFGRTEAKMPSTIIPRRTAVDTPSQLPLMTADANEQNDNVVCVGADAIVKARRHIPRGAQATIVERGNRLLSEKKYDEALTCFLALLFAAVDSEDKVLPTQLTECLRGVGQCYMALGKSDLGVRFLQAERRVFEEMVVLAAKPPGSAACGAIPQRSIIASLLGKKGPETMPKRCYTLGEVADACTKLGHHDIALAYRVKAAALRQRVSGEPLDPESEEAAVLAQSMHAFQASQQGKQHSSALCDEDDPLDVSPARALLQRDLREQVEVAQTVSAVD